jgi:Transposase DDE domain
MARAAIEVTFKGADDARVPEALTEGALLLMDLEARGVLAELGERLRIRRQGGYCALDIFLFLLLFLTTGTERGMRAFWELLRPHRLRLAALAGRRLLPTPASVSRALGAVEPGPLREAADFLLLEATGADEVLSHPVVRTVDACGEGWQVFDLDPTVTTLRHRGLPAKEDLPEPQRRSASGFAPGHSGRKRGDVQYRRMSVQDAGSGVCVHAQLSPGNGEGMEEFEQGLDAVVRLCGRLKQPLQRVVLRMDGEFGNLPWFAACRARGLSFVTRLNRPKLFEAPEVLKRLREATGSLVPSSEAGPVRGAADLGVLTLHPGERTRRKDGGRYEPLKIRVVASRFPKAGEAKRGQTLDGWQVELFAVDLPQAAFPAAEAVALYYGRCGQENRFAQEDRELGLDRILSYHLPGQELATLVGLFLWNLRVVKGFLLCPPRAGAVPGSPRQALRDDRTPVGWPHDPVLRQAFAEMDWMGLLSSRPGWNWDKEKEELRCPEGRALALTSVRPEAAGAERTGAIFCRPIGGCQDCASRTGCLATIRYEAAKHIELAVPTPIATRLRERLALIRGKAPGRTCLEPQDVAAGPRAVQDALFLPAMARQCFAELFRGASLRVEVKLPAPAPPRPRLVAIDVADRQRRRKTWKQNLDRYALPEGASLRVEVAGGEALMTMLDRQPSLKRVLGACA